MIRLSVSTGQLLEALTGSSDHESEIERDAILIHAGPNGTPITFKSGDGEISFDDDRIQRIVNNQNQKTETLAIGYGGLEKMPTGAFPPILDQHNDDSNDRIRGRLVSRLRFEKRTIPGVGSDVACAIGKTKFLGKDTVEKVKDGRIYHLSVGIHEDSDTLGELSTVIEPAAPGAMLLSRVKPILKGERSMSKKMKQLKANQARVSKLEAISGELTKLSGRADTVKKLIGDTRINLTTSMREANVSGRFKKLMADHKLTPVEFKTLDIKRLAALKDEDFEAVMKPFDARLVIEDKRQFGTTDAIEFGELSKNLGDDQRKRLKAEAKNDMKRMSGKSLSKEEKEAEKGIKKLAKEAPIEKDHGAVHGQEGDEEQLKKMKGHMDAMKAHLEKGDIEGAKKAHLEMSKHMETAPHHMKHLSYGDVKSEDQKKSMDTLQGQIDEIHTNMARLAGMVSELMEVEKAEGHELESKVKAEDEPGGDGKPAPGEGAKPGEEKPGEKKEGGEKPPEKKEGEKSLEKKEGEEKPGEKKEGGEKPPEKKEEKKG